jgi:hypothetical protein
MLTPREIRPDLLRRLSSISWIEIGSYVDSLRSCACPISPDFTTNDLIEIKLDQECRCRSGRSTRASREWQVHYRNGVPIMQGWEKTRAAAKYLGERALFLLLATGSRLL